MQALVMDEIAAIYENIAAKVGRQKYEIWFKSSTKLTLSENYLKISVPNNFIAGWIENHFLEEIKSAAKYVTGIDVKIAFNITPELLGRKKGTSAGTEKKVSEITSKTLKTEPVKVTPTTKKIKRLKLKLDDFIVGPCNKLAFNAAKTVAEKPEAIFNPLFIHGSYGIGKTHLLQGVCNDLSNKCPNAKCIYVSAEDFTNQYVMALKNKSLDKFRNKFRQADILAIDDIHFLANKKSTQEEFLHTFNTIDLANKKVVLASDAHPKMIEQLTESLVSRFVSGMVVKIEVPDFETRLKICKKHAASLKTKLSDDVLTFVAKNITKSIRELEGALLKLSAFATISGKTTDVHTAKQILADSITSKDAIVTVEKILSATADYFDTTVGEIKSASKQRKVSLARSVCMFLSRELTDLSYPEIGAKNGNKNHPTVNQANKKIKKMLTDNKTISWKSELGITEKTAEEILEHMREKISI